MHTKKSQAAQILRWLQRGRGLTKISAARNLNCWCLTSRISDLRKEGYPIETDMVEGENSRFARYRIKKS